MFCLNCVCVCVCVLGVGGGWEEAGVDGVALSSQLCISNKRRRPRTVICYQPE